MTAALLILTTTIIAAPPQPASVDLCFTCDPVGWHIYETDGAHVDGQITMMENAASRTPLTELLLSFDSIDDELINTKFDENPTARIGAEIRYFGTGSAHFIFPDETIELVPAASSILRSTSDLGDFTLSMWIRPGKVTGKGILFERIGPVMPMIPGTAYVPREPAENGFQLMVVDGYVVA